MLANPCIGAPRHRLLTGHPSQHSSGTRVPPRCSKRHRGQWVVSGELTRFSQASQYRPASPTDRLLKRMETGRGGCCNPSPASVSDQVHQTSYPYEEAFKQDTGGWRWPPSHRRPRRRMQDVPDGDCNPLRAVLSRSDGNHRQHSRQDQLLLYVGIPEGDRWSELDPQGPGAA